MPLESVQVPHGVTTAGLLGRRYLARVVDSLCAGILVVTFLAAESAMLPSMAEVTLVNLVLCLALWIGYGAGFESSAWQATLGKRLFGLMVYTGDAGRLSFSRACRRNFLKDGPFLLLPYVPGGQLWVLIWLGAHILVMHRSPANQAIHDRVFKTFVAASEETIQLHIA